MTSGIRSYDPRRTVAQRWWSRLAGLDSGPRPHWQTKVAYYTAVRDILTRHPDQPLTWRTVVAAVRPRGSGSTFYEVTGRNAKHALIDIYAEQDDAEALQIAWRYRRSRAVDQLVDETKVWSFWPYREEILLAQATGELAIGRYLVALVQWADRHPALAAALDYAPPACAVEDLVVLSHGTLGTAPVVRQLTSLIRRVIDGPGAEADHCGPVESIPVQPSPRFVHSRHPVVKRTQAIEVDEAAPTTIGLQESLVA
jgi:hypothetical protein